MIHNVGCFDDLKDDKALCVDHLKNVCSNYVSKNLHFVSVQLFACVYITNSTCSGVQMSIDIV